MVDLQLIKLQLIAISWLTNIDMLYKAFIKQLFIVTCDCDYVRLSAHIPFYCGNSVVCAWSYLAVLIDNVHSYKERLSHHICHPVRANQV